MNQKARGFTLLELIVVMTIIGIISYYALLYMPNQTVANLEVFTREVKEDILLTRALSMSYNSRYRIVFTSSGYSIENSSGTVYTNPITGSASTITAPSGVTIANTFASNTLVFNGLGIPYSTTAQLTSNGTVTISTTGSSNVITVVAYTGEVA